jgi:hypothetical protein
MQSEDPRRRRVCDDAPACCRAVRDRKRPADPAGVEPGRLRLWRRQPLPEQAAHARVRVCARRFAAAQRLRARDELHRARARRRCGRRRSVARPNRKPESLRALAERLPQRGWQTPPCRTSTAAEQVTSRFAFVRVVATPLPTLPATRRPRPTRAAPPTPIRALGQALGCYIG